MENFKVKVNTAEESKEVQGLFYKLNLDCVTWSSDMRLPFFICNWIDGEYSNYSLQDSGLNHLKETTIPELKDMVVLKRNSVEDANYECHGSKYYLTSDNKNHCWHKVAENGVPVFKWVHCGTPLSKEFKPIQKEKNMKEFLNSGQNYSFVKCCIGETTIPESWIEIPDGANVYARCNIFGDHKWLPEIIDGDWSILWKREKPQEKCAEKEPMEEELEFAEELRNMGESSWSKEKHSHYKRSVSHINTIDPYRIADLYDLHPCAEHIMKKSLCAGGRGHKDLLRDIQDIIDTAERWKEMVKEDNYEV